MQRHLMFGNTATYSPDEPVGGAPAAGTPAAGTPAPAPVTWTTGLTAEEVGHVQNRGWHDKPAEEAAREAIRAHRAAEAMIGVPADRIVKLPAATDQPEAWNAVWQKLGKPADGKYDLSSVKVGDAALPQADADWIGARANELNLSQDGAIKFAQEFVKRQTDAAATALTETTAKLAEEKGKLAANWGPNADANLYVAKQTALKLGVTPEQVAALENTIGYAATMEMFRSIGQKTGEDSFVSNGGDFNKGVMTREQAVTRKAELMADDAWSKRYLAGDVAANRELTGLLTIITSS